ncbi:hypothetical protein B0A48_10193 [Cryoendolithus antarcticus]|uniref:Uncharacterized protein n=1 Tax=Cryoendolithus antarcticus TaxID=1507870 RepID=A0A1V8SWS0_9PEZI|nr:hypothetical protein B0A48_10193 [Cryoendolithus antarcticus]
MFDALVKLGEGMGAAHTYSPTMPPPSQTISTYSAPLTSGVFYENSLLWKGHPDEILLVTIRIYDGSEVVDGSAEELPQRPPTRGFMERLSTRLGCAKDKPYKIQALRMPRHEYDQHHRRDVYGEYAGSEPQRWWTSAMLEERYGRYQQPSSQLATT